MHSFEDIKIVHTQLFNELGALIHFLLCRHKAPYQIQSMLTIHHFPETNIPEYNITAVSGSGQSMGHVWCVDW